MSQAQPRLRIEPLDIGFGLRKQACEAIKRAITEMDIYGQPEEIRLDRKPNPHLSFGFGAHLCLGAPQARLVLRSVMKALCEQVERIEILEAVPHFEVEAEYRRAVGYDALRARLVPIARGGE